MMGVYRPTSNLQVALIVIVIFVAAVALVELLEPMISVQFDVNEKRFAGPGPTASITPPAQETSSVELTAPQKPEVSENTLVKNRIPIYDYPRFIAEIEFPLIEVGTSTSEGECYVVGKDYAKQINFGIFHRRQTKEIRTCFSKMYSLLYLISRQMGGATLPVYKVGKSDSIYSVGGEVLPGIVGHPPDKIGDKCLIGGEYTYISENAGLEKPVIVCSNHQGIMLEGYCTLKGLDYRKPDSPNSGFGGPSASFSGKIEIIRSP